MRVGAGIVKVSASMLMLLLGCFSLRAQVAQEIKITFPLGQSQIEREFDNNAGALSALDSLLKDPSILSAQKIFIRSAASPEGPLWLNRQLSRERSMALKRYVLLHNPQLEGKLSFYAIPEDWSLIPAEGTGDKSLLLDYSQFLPSARYAKLFWVQESSLPSVVDTVRGLPALSFPVGQIAPLPERPAMQARKTLRPVLGISTNLLYDITYIPNYGLTSIPSFSLEYYPSRGHWTVGADVEWPMWRHWNVHKFMQINNITLWTRRYFKPVDGRFRGLYLLANVNVARYGIGWEEHGWEGEGIGASVGVGYKLTFGRFFLDMGLAAGAFYSPNDPYVYGNDATRWYYYDYTGDPSAFKPRSKRFFWAGPTRIYISVGLDLFNRKRK